MESGCRHERCFGDSVDGIRRDAAWRGTGGKENAVVQPMCVFRRSCAQMGGRAMAELLFFGGGEGGKVGLGKEKIASMRVHV